jgi:hypothetical protein
MQLGGKNDKNDECDELKIQKKSFFFENEMKIRPFEKDESRLKES